MKKIFTLIALLASTAAAMATDYTGKLVVNLNGTNTVPTDAVVTIDEQADGKYSLELKNFMLVAGKDEEAIMPIGTINLTDVDGTAYGNSTILRTSQTITIADGDMEGVDFWMGPMVGEVPLNLVAEIKDEKLYALINIDMPGIGAIEVTVGDVYQIPNSGFELFHTATNGSKTSDEPDYWHSFMSCSGSLAKTVNGNTHTFISEDVRPGSAGSYSALVKSVAVKVIIFTVNANGTMTTGRLQAGATSASDTKNCAFLDLTSTDVDANGDPFYTYMNGRPDSLSVWVKFKQEKELANYPYATVTAVITDGSYYQEPADKDYSDIIVARAANATIESNGGVWQKITIPFEYGYTKTVEDDDNNTTSEYVEYKGEEPKTILVTFSTNATPGQGNGSDELYVDDLELIYNSDVTGISVKGTPIADFGLSDNNTYEVLVDGESADITADDIEVNTNGKGARVFIDKADVDCIGGGSDATITVTSNDLKNSKTYVVKTRNSLYAGINNASIGAGDKAKVVAVYNLNGQQINTPAKGSICITKYSNGKIVKTIVK